MKRIFTWLADNADAAIGLTLAIVVSVLGIINAVPAYVIANATVLMLATMAFIMLRDRQRAETAARLIQESNEATAGRLDGSMTAAQRELRRLSGTAQQLLDTLPGAAEVSAWRESVAQVGEALVHSAFVQVVPGDDLRHIHTMAREGTDHWVFKGGTGAHLRAVTLPQCVQAARHAQRTFDLQFEVIDPTNRDLCALYARFRASLEPHGDAAGEEWTVDRIRKEAFATILAACWHRQRYTLLKIEGALSPVMTTFRTDMSASHVIIAQETPRSPALVVEAGKPHFSAYEQELRSSFEQGTPVALEQARDFFLSDEPTVEEGRRLFSRLGIGLPSTFRDTDVSDIIVKAIKPRNPYE